MEEFEHPAEHPERQDSQHHGSLTSQRARRTAGFASTDHRKMSECVQCRRKTGSRRSRTPGSPLAAPAATFGGQQGLELPCKPATCRQPLLMACESRRVIRVGPWPKLQRGVKSSSWRFVEIVTLFGLCPVSRPSSLTRRIPWYRGGDWWPRQVRLHAACCGDHNQMAAIAGTGTCLAELPVSSRSIPAACGEMVCGAPRNSSNQQLNL